MKPPLEFRGKQSNVADVLEWYLKRARAGELAAVAIATVTDKEATSTEFAWEHEGPGTLLSGAVSRLNIRLNMHLMENEAQFGHPEGPEDK